MTTPNPAAEGPVPRSTPALDAATVMLLRDGDEGLEVFMLRRNLQSDFVGGAYVFPGGGVDDHDRHADLDAVCHGLTDADASARLGIARGGLAFYVAAVRESFEEAGVLLARPVDAPDAEIIRFDDPAVDDRFDAHRRAVDRGERRLVDICAEEGLSLAVDRMEYVSHWITPEGPTRRYDTRFFVAAAPEHQVPLHDDREVIANLWVRPVDALARHHRGELEMIFPTVRSLEWLEGFATTAEVLAAARDLTDIPAILPRIVVDDTGDVRLVLPGEAGYEEAAPAATPSRVEVTQMATMARQRTTGHLPRTTVAHEPERS